MIKEFSNVFNELNSKITKFIDDQLNTSGLVRTHYRILHELVDGKERSMSELSHLLQVTKPNITVLIDKLEKLDYVQRVNSSNDRRVSLIRLTNTGQIFIDKTVKELIISSTQILNTLDVEDRDLIKQTTQAIKKLLTKLNNKY